MPYSPMNMDQDPSAFDLAHLTMMQPSLTPKSTMPPMSAAPEDDEDEDLEDDFDEDEDEDEDYDDEEDDEDFDDEDEDEDE